MTEANMTIGEVGRVVLDVRNDVRTLDRKVEDKFAGLDGTYVRTDVYLLTVATLQARCTKLENNLGWVARTVGGAFIVAIVGAIAAASGWGGIG